MAQPSYLTVVNRVLLRLREPTVTSLSGTSENALLIAHFVNEAKDEVEAAWEWNYRTTTTPVTTVANQATYALTGYGDEFSVHYVFDETNNFELQHPTDNVFISFDDLAGADTGRTATYWDIYGVDSSGDPYLRLGPTPTDAGTELTVHASVKQGWLTPGTDDGTLIKVPWRPVYLKTVVLAVSERGEDGGASFDELNQMYNNALADAVARDVNLSHKDITWKVG